LQQNVSQAYEEKRLVLDTRAVAHKECRPANAAKKEKH